MASGNIDPMASTRRPVGGNPTRSNGPPNHRRHEYSVTPHPGDGRGRSGSRGDSSLISTHPQTFATSDSLTTGTQASSKSNGSRRSVDDTQQLCVLEPDSQSSEPVPSQSFHLGTIQRHSTVLFDRLNRDRMNQAYYSTIVPQKPVSARALRLFLRSIDEPPPRPGTRAHELDFPMFFELSIVLWTYVCSIGEWTTVATEIKNQYWLHDRDNRTPDRLMSWLFLGLLYDWVDVFEEASLELLVNCSKFQDEVDKARFIPTELLNEINTKRQQYARETYKFIRDKYLMLLRPASDRQIPLVGTIHAVLEEKWNIDIRADLPPNLYRHQSPEKLLREVESTTSKSHSEPAQMILPARRTNSPPRRNRDDDSHSVQDELSRLTRGNRNSEAADALSLLMKEAFRKIGSKRRSANRTPQPAEPQFTRHELDDICDRLLADCRNFRAQTFRPLSLASFSALRSRQLILATI